MPQLCLSRWSPVSRKRGKGRAGNETGSAGGPVKRDSPSGVPQLLAQFC